MAGKEMLFLHGKRIVVPQPARKKLLKTIHKSHSGINKTWEMARQLYFWPGLRNEIVQLLENCKHCQERQPSQPSLKPKDLPNRKNMRPMERIGVDLMEEGGIHL